MSLSKVFGSLGHNNDVCWSSWKHAYATSDTLCSKESKVKDRVNKNKYENDRKIISYIRYAVINSYDFPFFRHGLHENWYTITVFVLHLAVCDILYCSVNLPFYAHLFLGYEWKFGEGWCVGSIILAFVFSNADWMALALIALSRALSLFAPDFLQDNITKGRISDDIFKIERTGDNLVKGTDCFERSVLPTKDKSHEKEPDGVC